MCTSHAIALIFGTFPGKKTHVTCRGLCFDPLEIGEQERVVEGAGKVPHRWYS